MSHWNPFITDRLKNGENLFCGQKKWTSILQTEKWRKWKLKRLRSLLVALPWKRARLVDFLNENSIIAVKGRFWNFFKLKLNYCWGRSSWWIFEDQIWKLIPEFSFWNEICKVAKLATFKNWKLIPGFGMNLNFHSKTWNFEMKITRLQSRSLSKTENSFQVLEWI